MALTPFNIFVLCKVKEIRQNCQKQSVKALFSSVKQGASVDFSEKMTDNWKKSRMFAG